MGIFVSHQYLWGFLSRVIIVIGISLSLISLVSAEEIPPEPFPGSSPQAPFIDENNSFYNGSVTYNVPIVIPPGTGGCNRLSH